MRETRLAFLIYSVLVAALLLGAFFPTGRVWGINMWGNWTTIWPLILLITGAMLGAGLAISTANAQEANPAHRSSLSEPHWLVCALVPALIAMPLFWLCRAQSHFSGDGYTVIGLMSTENPLIKARNLLGTMAPLLVQSLIGKPSIDTARQAYQIVSVGAGGIFVFLCGFFAVRQSGSLAIKILLFLLLATGGYSLQFFGYVENYSLFLVCVLLIAMIGFSNIDQGAQRLWIVPLTILAIGLHLFGVFLLPPLLFVLLHRTPAGMRWMALAIGTKWLIVGAAAAAVLAIIGYFYSTNIFVESSINLPWNSRFTTDGYTLFSADHLLDMVNLLLLLCSGAIVTIFAAGKQLAAAIRAKASFQYLALMSASSIAGIFICDPELGMPRDWDLFAFAGIPVVVLSGMAIVQSTFSEQTKRVVLILAAGVSLLFLGPRVGSLMTPAHAITELKEHIRLHRGRSRSVQQLLIAYYKRAGDSAAVQRETALFEQLFPEQAAGKRVFELLALGKLAEAKQLAQAALAANPSMWDGYANLGMVLQAEQKFDSALAVLTIANGLNPYYAPIEAQLGWLHYQRREYDKALQYAMHAQQQDSKLVLPPLTLAYHAIVTGNQNEAQRMVQLMTEQEQVNARMLKELGQAFVQVDWPDEAGFALSAAIAHGLDSLEAAEVILTYPTIRSTKWFSDFPEIIVDTTILP